MALAVSPEGRILERLLFVLSGSGIVNREGKTVTFRHARGRYSNSEEMPSCAIRYISSEYDVDRGEIHTTDECCMKILVDLELDNELATEESELDPTGIDEQMVILSECCAALLAPDGAMLSLVDDVEVDSIAPDDDATADEGRLVGRISVLYRTSRTNRGILLTPEQNL